MSEQTRTVWQWTAVWSTLFALNAGLPLALGLLLFRDAGLPGMFAALWVLWAAGVVGGASSERFRLLVTAGGYVVTMLQVCPILQGGAALVGYVLADGLIRLFAPGGPVGPVLMEVAVFTLTLIAGQLLIALAALFGRWVVGDEPKLAEPGRAEEG